MLKVNKNINNMLANLTPTFTYEYGGSRAYKEDAKENLTVTIDDIIYDADLTAINYMSSVISLANFNVFKSVTYDDVDIATAFNTIFVDTTIDWVCADNIVRSTPLGTIASVLNEAMNQTATVVGATS